jgi:aryl-phospho-beta-D-glucosidase BglC (GH1 family)
MKILVLFAALLAVGRSGAAQTGFVRTEGKEVIGVDGKPLMLRGISLGNWLLPEGYMFGFDSGVSSGREIDALFRDLAGPDATNRFWRVWRDTYISQDDIELIRKAGFNSVRIPLHHALFVENGAGFAVLDRVIGWCKAAGLPSLA